VDSATCAESPALHLVWLHAVLRFGSGTNFASFLRFWAAAARMNSSWAPVGPFNLSRSSLRMRLRCANSISTFLRKGCGYVGVCQYDMRWTPPAAAALRELARDNIQSPPLIYGKSVGVLCNREGRLHPLTFVDRVNWAFLLASYNSYFGTKHQPQIFIERHLSLFQTYVMPTSEFVALASWLRVLCDELYPAHCSPPYETHWGSLGGKTERAAAIFVAARMQENGIAFRDLPLHHDENLVRQLNITKGHYKN